MKKMVICRDFGNDWAQNSDRNAETFLSSIRTISDKTATMVKSTTLIAYLVYAFFLNMSGEGT